jgi:hypothetical protein
VRRRASCFFDQTRELAIHLPADVAKAVVQKTLDALGQAANAGWR